MLKVTENFLIAGADGRILATCRNCGGFATKLTRAEIEFWTEEHVCTGRVLPAELPAEHQ